MFHPPSLPNPIHTGLYSRSTNPHCALSFLCNFDHGSFCTQNVLFFLLSPDHFTWVFSVYAPRLKISPCAEGLPWSPHPTCRIYKYPTSVLPESLKINCLAASTTSLDRISMKVSVFPTLLWVTWQQDQNSVLFHFSSSVPSTLTRLLVNVDLTNKLTN